MGTLRYSWLATAFCVLCIVFSPVICSSLGGHRRTHRAWTPNVPMVFWLCGCGRRRRLGGNAPEDRGSGLLNGFQTFAEKVAVSVPKLDVVGGRGSRLKADGLANHKSHGFGFGLADLLGGEGATVAAMEHLVADLMDEGGKFLGGLHAQQQGDLSTVG